MSEILNWLNGVTNLREILSWLNGLAAGLWIGSMIQEYYDNKKRGE